MPDENESTPPNIQPDLLPTDLYLEHVLADTDRLAAAVRTGPLTAPVAACPNWDLQAMTEHMGYIFRWAAQCATDGASPDDLEPLRAPDGVDLPTWLTDGAVEVAHVLRALDPAATVWNPFPAPQDANTWARRMAIETLVHRWDGERAVGTPSMIDPVLASDGIDETFQNFVPRWPKKKGLDASSGSLHVHCTDTPGEWLVWIDDAGYQLVRAHQKGDAALRGPAAAILLAMWGRDADRSELSPVGDEAVLGAWLNL